jgi:fucose permease
MLAVYGYFLNVLGPITPYLMDEMQISYTVSSLHFTAFAVGILLIGMAGHRFIKRMGRWTSLWIGAVGLSAGALLLISGKNPWATITASFIMGLIGSLILAIVPSALSDQHREYRSVALSEANVMSSIVSALAPLMVGWMAGMIFGWRMALAIPALVPVALYMGFRKSKAQIVDETAVKIQYDPAGHQKLPAVFWVYWTAIVLAVSVEFCMVFWSADYMEKALGLQTANAAQSVSLFLAGMILGRLAGSILVRKMRTEAVIAISIILAAAGFLIYWAATIPLVAMLGLFVCGMGTGGLYPLILSLAMGSAGSLTVEASSRATLASGTAILLLPLILGWFADRVGIRLAYGIIILLLTGVTLMMLAARFYFPLKETPTGTQADKLI